MKKQQATQSKLGQNQKTIIPTVRYHPTIQIHAAGDGPAVKSNSGPASKLSPRTGKKKVVQQNQDNDNIIPGSPQPRTTGRKKQTQAGPKLASRAVRPTGPSAPLNPHSSQAASGTGVMTAGPEVHMDLVKVESLTRGQRNNPEWFAWRKNRITASVAHNIARSRFANGNSKIPPKSYLAAITGKQHPPPTWTQSCDRLGRNVLIRSFLTNKQVRVPGSRPEP